MQHVSEENAVRAATAASVHLDMLRGMSAVAVLVYHVRYRFFLDYADLESPGIVAKIFYGATSFGHDAVMAFFVLSGLLIANSIARSSRRQSWSWTDYILSRLTRLYVVLIPALLLTLLWDWLGISLHGNHSVYNGEPQAWKHDYFNVSQRLSALTLFGNVAFLQTIFVPPFGSNEPLWSLAYEFWYYGLFPCIYLMLFYYKSWWARTLCLVAAIAMATLVGRQILIYFPIWLLGALLGFLPLCVGMQGWVKVAATILAGLFAVAMAMLGHVGTIKLALGGSTAMDYFTGVGVAVLVYVLLHYDEVARAGIYAKVARWSSEFSFTLYLTHIPLLVWLRSLWISGRPWDGSLEYIAAAFGLSAMAILFAWVVYWFTERHTRRVKAWFLARAADWSQLTTRSIESASR